MLSYKLTCIQQAAMQDCTTITGGGAENAGLKMRNWKLQDWKM